MEEHAEMAPITCGDLDERRLDPVWDRHADKLSIGTYDDYFTLYGVCTVLRAGHVAGYYKKMDGSEGTIRLQEYQLNKV